MFLFYQQTIMMTRSKTIATANASANVQVEPETIANKTTDNNSTVLYPSMFDRWKLPL